METFVEEINSIQFGLFSTEEILSLAVCELNNTRMTVEPGTVYDERMGPINNKSVCGKCEQESKYCPGHLGYIKLAEPIIHPIFIKYINLFIRLFCLFCSKFLMTKDNLTLHGVPDFKKREWRERFNMIVEVLEKQDICQHCTKTQPKYTLINNDGRSQLVAILKLKNKQSKRTTLNVHDINKIFGNVLDDDIILIGLDPKMFHPRNLIIQVLPVLPPRARPRVVADLNMCDDDLTVQYNEIIKKNEKLKDPNFIDLVKRKKEIDKVFFRVKSLFDNSQGRAKHSNVGRVIKGIRERISGKDGIIRCNLLGKRVNQSARTVLGPDVTLRIGEMVVPHEIAENLTIQVFVNDYNLDKMNRFLREGKINYYYPGGDNNHKKNMKYVLKNQGTKVELRDLVLRSNDNNNKKQLLKITKSNLKGFKLHLNDRLIRNSREIVPLIFPASETFKLKVGDKVDHQLISNESYVLLNRQPTLTVGSMIAHKIIVKDHKTFRLPLGVTSSFNA
eukprot:Pgem_evm1s2241